MDELSGIRRSIFFWWFLIRMKKKRKKSFLTFNALNFWEQMEKGIIVSSGDESLSCERRRVRWLWTAVRGGCQGLEIPFQRPRPPVLVSVISWRGRMLQACAAEPQPAFPQAMLNPSLSLRDRGESSSSVGTRISSPESEKLPDPNGSQRKGPLSSFPSLLSSRKINAYLQKLSRQSRRGIIAKTKFEKLNSKRKKEKCLNWHFELIKKKKNVLI